MSQQRKHHRLKPRNTVFSRWISSTGLSLTQIATLIGCSIQAVSNFRGGHCKPGRELANKISEASAGAVPSETWDREPRKRRTAA